MSERCNIYIYDDTFKFLDFVSEKIAAYIAVKQRVIFSSSNISLETLIRSYYSDAKKPKMVYQEHLQYLPLKSMLTQFTSTRLSSFSTALIIDFGSFCGSDFSVQQIVQIHSELSKCESQISLCFDCRLLSPSELSYLIALVPNVYINNIGIDKQASELVKVPRSMNVQNANGIVNSALLDLTVKLAQTQKPVVNIIESMSMQRIESQMSLNQFSRDEYDHREDFESSFLVPDSMAAEHVRIESQNNLLQLESVSTGRMKRNQSKVGHGSKINLQFLDSPHENGGENYVEPKQEENVIEFKFETSAFRKK
ncbi:Conserved_hypothetical protein [Hexamita inflata]|uniref:Uncharacterized protein n=1 Tax=Hexamita inflata TaxID=28002 RepID=A0ABP1H862_9EUKA